MKHLIVSAAGLGWETAERHNPAEGTGLRLRPAESVFPAVTCTAQAGFRTAAPASAHGMVCNGIYERSLRKPSFWEQSSRLVAGRRIWQDARDAGMTVGIFFWQQSLGEAADFVISPAPIHKHGGGTIMDNYVLPGEAAADFTRRFGAFPLHRYWGPLASPRAGDAVTDHALAACDRFSPDLVFLYLPTLDYDFQRFGPEDPRCARSAAALSRQLARLARRAERDGADMTLFGDYEIRPVTAPPAYPNLDLRRAGLFRTRTVRGMAYPDFHTSRAFALADHEIAHVYVRDPDDAPAAAAVLEASGRYSEIAPRKDGGEWAHPNAGELLLTAKPGSWCAYKWWDAPREAPDFAWHVDIHNKPGFDPCELFFDRSFPPKTCRDDRRVKGTHGRKCAVAFASTAPGVSGRGLLDVARALRETFRK